MSLEYLIGATQAKEQRIWVGFRPRSTEQPEAVCVSLGPISRDSVTYVLAPTSMIEYCPHILHGDVENGVWKTTQIDQEPPGWFERKCREANCKWFVPFVKRMADGEEVPIKEIEVAYLAHNGKPMPRGKWSEMFR